MFTRQFRALFRMAGLWAVPWSLTGIGVACYQWITTGVASAGSLGGLVLVHALTFGAIGLICGLDIGLLFSHGERGRRIEELSSRRVAWWGALGGATPPIVSGIVAAFAGAPVTVSATLIGMGLVSAAAGAAALVSAVEAARRGTLRPDHAGAGQLLPVLALVALGSPSAAAAQPSPAPPQAVMVLAGGCFWGVEAIFEHVLGVQSVTSGFARPSNAEKGFVPVEAVRIVYDPSRLKPDQLLSIFFSVAHDPSSRDIQGPDEGPEYRAMVFYASPAERAAAESAFAAYSRVKPFTGPILTELRPFGRFAEAEAFHQDFTSKHPNDPYVVRNDLPKLRALEAQFPSLFSRQRAP